MAYDNRFGQNDRLTPSFPTSSNAQLRELEKDYFDTAKRHADSLNHQRKSDQNRKLAEDLRRQQERDQKRYGSAYRKVDVAKLPVGSEGWGVAQEQARKRDEAFEQRQKDLAAEHKNVAGTDWAKALEIKSQMRAEAAQYKADVQGDILAKEVIARGVDSPHAVQLREERDQYQKAADWAAKQHEAAKDLQSKKPAYEQRQNAYKQLEAHAAATGRKSEAEFVSKYRDFKKAQYRLGVAMIEGDPRAIEDARDKLKTAREEGIAAKAGLKTSQISQLSRELRAQQPGQRLLTTAGDQQGQKQGQKVSLANPLAAIGKPDPRIARGRENIAKAEERNGQKQVQEEKKPQLGDGIKSRGQERREWNQNLAKAGFTDDRVIRSISGNVATYRAVMGKVSQGRENVAKIQAARQQEMAQTHVPKAAQ